MAWSNFFFFRILKSHNPTREPRQYARRYFFFFSQRRPSRESGWNKLPLSHHAKLNRRVSIHRAWSPFLCRSVWNPRQDAVQGIDKTLSRVFTNRGKLGSFSVKLWLGGHHPTVAWVTIMPQQAVITSVWKKRLYETLLPRCYTVTNHHCKCSFRA